MESPYFNSVMKEEGKYKDGGRGPTAETLCQWDHYPEVLGKQSSLPIFSRVASGRSICSSAL